MEVETIKLIRDLEIEIGSATILITADEETSPLTTLAAVCAANASELYFLYVMLPMRWPRLSNLVVAGRSF